MNGAFNRVDKNMMYLLQHGVPEWSKKVIYPANAIIKYNGVLYTAIVENDNAIPTTSDKWKKTNAETPSASTTQKGVVKLNSATNSSSETEAATPLAVKNVNDNANHAHARINALHDYAVGVNNNVNYVNDRVNIITDKFQTDNYESRVYSADKRVYMVIRNDGVLGMYSHVKNEFSWFINHDGWIGGFIEAPRVGGLDQFVKDRTLPVGIPQPWPKSTPLLAKM